MLRYNNAVSCKQANRFAKKGNPTVPNVWDRPVGFICQEISNLNAVSCDMADRFNIPTDLSGFLYRLGGTKSKKIGIPLRAQHKFFPFFNTCR